MTEELLKDHWIGTIKAAGELKEIPLAKIDCGYTSYPYTFYVGGPSHYRGKKVITGISQYDGDIVLLYLDSLRPLTVSEKLAILRERLAKEKRKLRTAEVDQEAAEISLRRTKQQYIEALHNYQLVESNIANLEAEGAAD